MSDFEEYKKQGEPDKQKKAENWGVAIGLQQVDGLLPSKYLIEVAKDNIEGKISIDEAAEQVKQYYKINPAITLKEQGEKEADEVSARIAKILSTHTFSFSPMEYISIHKALFSGIFDDEIAGKLRTYDITKDEPILNGDTVIYGRSDSLKETLDYDFQTEKNFNYMGLSKAEKVAHLAKFISGIWQIHPFGEGNTRATAVFTIKYLYTLGFKTNNDLFEKHSKYFRNALVRANYQNLEKDIPYTMEYLNKFLVICYWEKIICWITEKCKLKIFPPRKPPRKVQIPPRKPPRKLLMCYVLIPKPAEKNLLNALIRQKIA